MGEERVKLKLGKHFFVLKHRKLVEGVKGIDSTTQDGKHVLFIDIDDIKYSYLKERVYALIEKFKISDCYIFCTKPESFHVICLDKFTFGEVMDMLIFFDNERTYKYRVFAGVRDKWVLRISGKYNRTKPKLLGCTRSVSSRKQSTAHAKFLETEHGIVIDLTNPDGLSQIGIDSYPTVVKTGDDEVYDR